MLFTLSPTKNLLFLKMFDDATSCIERNLKSTSHSSLMLRRLCLSPSTIYNSTRSHDELRVIGPAQVTSPLALSPNRTHPL